MKLKMARLEVIGLKSQLIPTVRAIHALGCVQIEDLSEVTAVSARPLNLDRETVQRREELTYLVAKMEGLVSTLSAVQTEVSQPIKETPPDKDIFETARAGVDTLVPQVQNLVARRGKLEAEQSSLPRYETTLRKLLPIVPAAAHDPENIFVGVLVGRAHIWVLDALAEEVLKLSAGHAELAAEDVDEATRAMIIVVPREFADDLEQLLGREDISRLRLPDEIAGQPPDTAVLALSRRLATIPRELAAINAELAALAETWLPRLRRWRTSLRDQLDEINVLNDFGETEKTFVLVGWVPERDVERVQRTLATSVGEGVISQTVDIPAADRHNAPVALTNPAPARPFQSLVRLFSLPRYEGIDPTILMALFLPLFFGMILGDVGYGALLLLACLYALHRFPQPGTRHDIIQVLALGAGWSILFGVLYGEAFGTLGEALGMHALWFERASAEQVTSLLLLSVAVGVVHVTLGLILGVWEALRERSQHLLLERGGMLVGLVGLFLMTSVLAHWLPDGFMTPGVVVMLVGIVLLSVPLGWLGVLLGPIEFIGLIGNILSYLRIAAVGLASVYLARLANDMVGMMGSIVVGVILALLIHALNLVLGAFSPTIHSLRLHYVEFFRKFYEGGGQPFEPFQSRQM
ncbi:MAG: V-type ATP synthase subunit I [Ardenticatenaceae bacterium]|nr:V-type ATP synthase subunit I [Ardenticatenaceae bacterium]MCB9445087.1 V-type ATP synthase subunit I [Ardenticatenaceae bacterium]